MTSVVQRSRYISHLDRRATQSMYQQNADPASGQEITAVAYARIQFVIHRCGRAASSLI
jgi:hypothetical protein